MVLPLSLDVLLSELVTLPLTVRVWSVLVCVVVPELVLLSDLL
jgi:hypothetical protein